jgi:hypothetical protein
MSFEGGISSLGKTRDDDGTVDRVADPPQKMWAVLAAFKYKCEVENIEMVSIFEVRRMNPSTAQRVVRRAPAACLDESLRLAGRRAVATILA